mgnify:CR=1 FL=1
MINILNTCTDLAPIVRLIKFGVLPALYIGIGIVLLVLVIIDIAKAIIAGDEKEVKAAQKSAIRRVIYGVAIFFVVVLINLVFNLLSSSGATTDGNVESPTWYSCWSCIEKDNTATCPQ